MKSNLTCQEIAQRIFSFSRILVVSHYNPDADAYGSSCGLTLALQEAGKSVICLNESGQIPRYAFIPGVEKVQNSIPTGDFEVVIACDCGDARRLGESFQSKLMSFPNVVNVDHHKSNDLFGTYNWVQADASSTSEMIYDILQSAKRPLSAAVASCLFAGISGDTGSFRYANTAVKTFEAASQLMRAGAKPGAVATALYSSDSLSSVKLHSEVLRNIKLFAGGKIALVVATQQMMAEFQATPDDTEALVEKARNIEGVQVSVFLREENNQWKGSLRSKSQDYDMSLIAQSFGGGGHSAAAGFKWTGSRADLEATVIDRVSKLF